MAEFLTFILDGAHSELLRLGKTYGAGDQEADADEKEKGKGRRKDKTNEKEIDDGDGDGDNKEEKEDAWVMVGRGNRASTVRQASGTEAPATRISAAFRGSMCSTIRVAGRQASATVQPFFIL